MRCFHPVTAWQSEDGGSPVFVERRGYDRKLELRCGQCIGCRVERSRMWAVRCVHESQLHEYSVFLTLTYDSGLDNLSLVYRDFQLFMKRLRRARSVFDVTLWHWVPRFYMCGEYGERNGRPHFHACVFGMSFPDRQYLRELPSGGKLYRSSELERLWPHGYSSIGDVTFESAAYVARYATKSLMKGHDGKRRGVDRGIVDDETGEFFPWVPEFNRMSLKPGIGALWFERFQREVYPRDYVVINGQKMKPPKYYDKLLAVEGGVMPSDVEFERFRKAVLCEVDSSPERLEVQEVVARARLSFKKRSLE